MNADAAATSTLHIANTLADLKKVVVFVEAYGRDHDLPVRAVDKLNLCLDEILNNTISYGYDGSTEGVISVSLSLDGPYLAAEIKDDAKPFDPRRSTKPELPTDLANRKPGGLGLHFVNSLMDIIDYHWSDGYNHITLKVNVRSACV